MLALMPEGWSRALVVAVLLMLTGCLGQSALNASNPFGPAHGVAQTWWSKEEQAAISGDPTELEDLYAGSALDVARGQMMMSSLKTTRPKYVRPFRGSVIFGPGGAAGWDWFIAIIQFAPVDQDGRAEAMTRSFPGLVFVSTDGTWKATVADLQAPIPHPLSGSSDATLATPPGDARFVLVRSAVAGSYSTYLNARAAGQFPEVPFPTGLDSYAHQLTTISGPLGSIATATFTFEVDTPDVAAYAITSGLTQIPEVVLFVIRRTVLIKPRQGCLVRRAGDIGWSDIVPPGSYSALAIQSVAVGAASIPLNNGDTSQGRKVIDIGGSIDDVGATGVKC
jgi:hypothetical protein